MMIRSFVLAAAACAALASAAQANPAWADQRIAVSTKGLDLSNPAGAKAFYRRLSQAVIAACGGAPTSFFASEEERFQACYRASLDEAVGRAQAPLVAALHAGQPARSATLASR